jgi:hypothetical protein
MNMRRLFSLAGFATAGLATVLAAAGASAMEDIAPAEASSASGLVRLEDSELDEVWVRAGGAELSRFTAIYLVPVSVFYADRDPVVELDEEEIARVNDIMREEVTEALSGREDFVVANQPGPGVLELRAALTEMDINAPSRMDRHGVRTFVTSVGSMTLVAALRDSETGENLVLVRDHVEGRDHRLMLATEATYWAELRDAVADWSDLLRLELDAAQLAETGGY